MVSTRVSIRGARVYTGISRDAKTIFIPVNQWSIKHEILSVQDERTFILMKHHIVLTDHLSNVNVTTTMLMCSFHKSRKPMIYFHSSNENYNLIMLFKVQKRPRV